MINQKLDMNRVCMLVATYEQKDVMTGKGIDEVPE